MSQPLPVTGSSGLIDSGVCTYFARELGYTLHGAGLTNAVWSQNPTRIFELYQPEYFNSCFSSLASSLGHEYRNFKLAADPSANLARLISEHAQNPA